MKKNKLKNFTNQTNFATLRTFYSYFCGSVKDSAVYLVIVPLGENSNNGARENTQVQLHIQKTISLYIGSLDE